MIIECPKCGGSLDQRLGAVCPSCRRHRFISAAEFRNKIAAALGYRWPLYPHIDWPKKDLDSQQLDGWTKELLGMRRNRKGNWEALK